MSLALGILSSKVQSSLCLIWLVGWRTRHPIVIEDIIFVDNNSEQYAALILQYKTYFIKIDLQTLKSHELTSSHGNFSQNYLPVFQARPIINFLFTIQPFNYLFRQYEIVTNFSQVNNSVSRVRNYLVNINNKYLLPIFSQSFRTSSYREPFVQYHSYALYF